MRFRPAALLRVLGHIFNKDVRFLQSRQAAVSNNRILDWKLDGEERCLRRVVTQTRVRVRTYRRADEKPSATAARTATVLPHGALGYIAIARPERLRFPASAQRATNSATRGGVRLPPSWATF